ncbi:MAG: DNA polymerase III subunit delta [Deltaproteobacteria bacterium]|nr:DNA polymerase III subunit delta [Deltaproteobacteria bacterium]
MARKARRTTATTTDLPLQPVLVVCGVERALVDAAVRGVRHKFLQAPMADFNHDRLSGRTAAVEQILACARTVPMMARQRLVEVNDAEALNAEALDKIAGYAAQPAPHSVLLLVARDIDRRTRAARALEELGCLFCYQQLDEDSVVRIAQERARALGLTLDEEAAQLLVTAVGTELLLVERALEKLQLVVGSGPVPIEAIEEHTAQTRVESIFKLTDAIAAGDRARALEVVGQMLDAREAPLRILATLAWQQRQLIRARDLLDRGTPAPEVLRSVKVFRFGERFLRSVRALPRQRVASGLLLLERADRAFKSSRVKPRLALESAVLQLVALR